MDGKESGNKSPKILWAEKEVKLACQRENPNWDGKSFDYGCACYQSALKAFSTLCNDDHTKNTWFETVYILERLIHNLPLTPITYNDFGYIKGVTPELVDKKTGALLAVGRIAAFPSHKNEDGSLQYDCKRGCGVYMNVKPDGTHTISDINRTICVNIECPDDVYSCGIGSRLVDEMFPISLPYYPTKDMYEVYIRTFLTDPALGDFDTKEVVYIRKPDGKKIPVNRYWHAFKTAEGEEFREITKDEFDKLLEKRIDTQERNIAGHIANDIVNDLFDTGEQTWEKILGTKWKPDYDDEHYEEHRDEYESYNYCKIWWALMRNVYNDDECDQYLKDLEKSVAKCDILKNELSRWPVYGSIAKLDAKLLNKYPELQDVYDKTGALYEWVKQNYELASVKFNEYVKELDKIEDNAVRERRVDDIITEISDNK